MTKKILTVVTVASFILTSCGTFRKSTNAENNNTNTVETQNQTKMTNIAFTVAKNYFVNNTVTKLDNPKIETAEKFNENFGMATTMGEEGRPTDIDFSKQFVVAVILPETDLETSITPISLQKNTKNEIILNYKSIVGQKQTYKTRPNFAIIVDKKENGNITMKEIK